MTAGSESATARPETTTPAAEHVHHAAPEAAPDYDRSYWEERYSGAELTWSGRPNPVLVTEAEPLTPGRALDIGSGEGGDALWLAGQGWLVTGVDISQNALDKAQKRIAALDEALADRITWEQHDLLEWAPEPGSADLVSAQFMHLPDPARSVLFRALAAAVAPGGTLLIVGHDISEEEAGRHSGHFRELMFTPEDVSAAIKGEGLDVQVAHVRSRSGAEPVMRDVVVRATRPL